MKRSFCILLPALFFAFCFSISASAQKSRAEYFLFQDEGEYILAECRGEDGMRTVISGGIKDIFAYTDSLYGVKKITFFNVTADDSFDISGEGYIFCGKISLPLGMNVFGEATFFCDILNVERPICVSGTLTVCEGNTEASSERGAFRVNGGRLYVLGGEIVNVSGAAVYSSGALTLSGDAELFGKEYGVSTDAPISLSYNGKPFISELSVLYRGEFVCGKQTTVFLSVSEYNKQRVSLFDFYGVEYKWRIRSEGDGALAFGEVSLPFTVKYFYDGELIGDEECLSGELAEGIEAPEIKGYSFLGWYGNSGLADAYENEIPIFSNTSLYARYTLEEPIVKLLEKELEGSEGQSRLYVDISHPLLGEGEIFCIWMRDGVTVHTGEPYLDITVSEGGSYACTVVLSDGGESVTVSTGEAQVFSHLEGDKLDADILVPFLSVSFGLFLVLLYFTLDKQSSSYKRCISIFFRKKA